MDLSQNAMELYLLKLVPCELADRSITCHIHYVDAQYLYIVISNLLTHRVQNYCIYMVVHKKHGSLFLIVTISYLNRYE